MEAEAAATSSTDDDVVYEHDQRKDNRGNNVPGQKMRAKRHHTGKVDCKFITNPKARGQTFRKRKLTLIKKGKELSSSTGADVLIRMRYEEKQSLYWGTPTLKNEYKEMLQMKAESTPISEEAESTEPSTSGSLTIPPAETSVDTPSVLNSPSNLLRRRSIETQTEKFVPGPNKCPVCKVDYTRPVDERGFWLGCSEGDACSWWVHAQCIGLVGVPKDDLQAFPIYCPEHRDERLKAHRESDPQYYEYDGDEDVNGGNVVVVNQGSRSATGRGKGKARGRGRGRGRPKKGQ